MKKILLTALCLLCLVGKTYAVQAEEINNAEIKQKACQNVFSLINIDFSFMSPRGTAADVNVVNSANSTGLPKQGDIQNISDKKYCDKQPCPCTMKKSESCPMPLSEKDSLKPVQNKTSLFRLDLFHFFKIQIL